jgi:hypothetical protein
VDEWQEHAHLNSPPPFLPHPLSLEALINDDAELLLAAVLNLEQRFVFVGLQVY